MKKFLNYLKGRVLPMLLTTMILALSPLTVQAARENQAVVIKEATVRSCPNRLCPMVQTMPKGSKFTWVLSKNGFVNIANTTFWVATSDIH